MPIKLALVMRCCWPSCPADLQEQALAACFKEVYNGAERPARILLPVRNLQFCIDSDILLVVKEAPFNKRDPQLVPAAGSCPSIRKILRLFAFFNQCA